MGKTFVKELGELVSAGIVTPEKAQEITMYFENQDKAKPNRFPIVVNILGALLASLGVVLMIAHNWDELGRLAKTIIAFIPLLLGQGLCAYALLKQKNNVAWLESSAVILFFGVASAISLISQTYHINGTLSGFLLTWMLLTVPLIYIMPSAVTALLYISGITWYACETGYFSYTVRHIPFYYIGLLVLLLPHKYRYWKYKRESNSFILLAWMLVLSLTIVLGAFAESDFNRTEWIFCAYLGMFGIFYLTGRSKEFEQNRLFANPFLSAGALGILFVLFFWSFEGLWSDFISPYYRETKRADSLYSPFFYLSIVLLLVTVWLIVTDYRRVNKIIFDPMGFSALLFFLLLLVSRHNPTFGAFSINAWILFAAIFFIRKGAIKDHLGILNFGLTIIALLAIFRFFDNQVPFVWRGLFFLATGAGFFAGNYLVVKKRKSLVKDNS